MTSMWSQSAPHASMNWASDAKLAKSEDSMEGAIFAAGTPSIVSEFGPDQIHNSNHAGRIPAPVHKSPVNGLRWVQSLWDCSRVWSTGIAKPWLGKSPKGDEQTKKTKILLEQTDYIHMEWMDEERSQYECRLVSFSCGRWNAWSIHTSYSSHVLDTVCRHLYHNLELDLFRDRHPS